LMPSIYPRHGEITWRLPNRRLILLRHSVHEKTTLPSPGIMARMIECYDRRESTSTYLWTYCLLRRRPESHRGKRMLTFIRYRQRRLKRPMPSLQALQENKRRKAYGSFALKRVQRYDTQRRALRGPTKPSSALDLSRKQCERI
jgi:hypothetical protein